MRTAEIQKILADITYKPGWRFYAYDGQWEGQHLDIWAHVEDSTDPGRMIDLRIPRRIPPINGESRLKEWLARELLALESHEMREWLRYDGKTIFDPHAPGAEHDE